MSSVTIDDAQTIVTGYQGSGTLYLAIYLSGDHDIVTDEGAIIPHGSPFNGNKFAYLLTCPVVDGLATIPQAIVEATENSSDPQATYFFYWLDDKFRPIQPFLQPARVPSSPVTTNWANLMSNLSVPLIIIDPTTTRTPGTWQKYDADHGVVDSIGSDNGSTAIIDGALDVASNIEADGFISSDSTVSGNALASTVDTTAGRDANVGRDVNVTRNLNAAHIIGEGSGITGVIAAGTGGTSSLGSLSLIADSDNTNAGEVVDELFGSGGSSFLAGRTSRVLKESFVPLRAPLQDKGGMVFAIAPVAGTTDYLPTYNSRLAQAVLLGGGTIYFMPSATPYPISDKLEILSNIHVRGGGMSFPNGHPFGDTGQPSGGTVLRLTNDNTALFHIGEHVANYSISRMGMIADSDTGTIAILFSNTDTVTSQSTFQGYIGHLHTWGFDVHISVDADTIEWQCDQVLVEKVICTNGSKSVYMNSQNSHNWLFLNCKFSPSAGGYGVYLAKSSPITFIGCSGETIGGKALFYFTAAHGEITIDNCNAETFDYFIDTEAAGSNTGSVVHLKNNIMEQPSRFRHNATIISEGNKYYDEGYFRSSDGGTDVYVLSLNDTVVAGTGGSPDFITQINKSPFYVGSTSQLISNSRADEIGRFKIKLGSLGVGIHSVGHLGIGTPPASDTLLKMMQTASEANTDVALLGLFANDGTTGIKLIRDHITGAIRYVATQVSVGGHQFEGAKLGFYGTSAIAKPTVSGSKGGNAALGSLITALANLGLIVDTTT